MAKQITGPSLALLDGRFVNVTGDTMTGDLTLQGTHDDQRFVYIDQYSHDNDRYGRLYFRKSNSNTAGTVLETTAGNFLGNMKYMGGNDANLFAGGAYMSVLQTGASGDYVPSRMEWATYSATGPNVNSIIIDSSGNVGFGEIAPISSFEISKAAPGFTLHNLTAGDADGDRVSFLAFRGHQSGNEESMLAKIEASHDGVADDENGILKFYTNEGGVFSERMSINSGGSVQIGSLNLDTNVITSDTDIISFSGDNLQDIGTLGCVDASLTGDLTIPDDGLFAATNTANYFWMADGTNYNPTSPADARTGLGLVAGGDGDIWVEKAGDTMVGTNSTTFFQIQQADTSVVFNVDTTNARVGIGTATPATQLDITGAGHQQLTLKSTDGFITFNFSKGGTNQAGRMGFLVGATRYWIMGMPDSDDYGDGTDFAIGTGDSSLKFIIDRTNNNIGIGNNVVPLARLHVVGDADSQQLIVQAHSTQTANILEIQKSDTTVLSGADERGILFSDGGIDVDSLFIGKDAGNIAHTNATNNVGIGAGALNALTTGDNNTAIGLNAGTGITEGNSNFCIGSNSGTAITTAIDNCFLGSQAGWVITGSDNTAIGFQAMGEIGGAKTAAYNVVIGSIAGQSLTIGDENAIIGRAAGQSATDADFNSIFGSAAGNQLTTGDSNIFIGYKSGFRQTTNSNLLIVDNLIRANVATELTNSILYGVMAATPAAQTLRINAGVTISQTTTFLDKAIFTQVDGNEYIDSLADGYMDYGATTGHRFNNTLDITTTTDPQLRLTHTDGVDETDFYTNSDGELVIMPTARTVYIGDGTDGDNMLGFYGDTSVMTLYHDDDDSELRISGNDATNYVAIEADGDVNFVAGAGLQFGEIWYHGAGFATTCTDAGTYYQVLGFDTDGEANGGVTPAHGNDHITVTEAGRYQISFSVSCRSTLSDEYIFMVCFNDGPINGTACQNIMAHRDTSNANALGVVACTGICDLPVSATVELWVQNADAAGRDIDIEHATLNVVQIGGTT